MPGQPESNLILAAISDRHRASFARAGHFAHRQYGYQLFATGEPIDELTFPLSGMVSLTVDTREGRAVEFAVTGNEGFAGVSRYLGRETADSNAVVQVTGVMLHVPAAVVIDAARQDKSLRAAIALFLNSLIVETAQSAICNQMHSVEQRMSRWLLHASDRAHTQDLFLTHEFLSQMLGVRRASVTDVVGVFGRAGLTNSQRGLITISDRDGLLALACECYEVVRAASPTYD